MKKWLSGRDRELNLKISNSQKIVDAIESKKFYRTRDEVKMINYFNGFVCISIKTVNFKIDVSHYVSTQIETL